MIHYFLKSILGILKLKTSKTKVLELCSKTTLNQTFCNITVNSNNIVLELNILQAIM